MLNSRADWPKYRATSGEFDACACSGDDSGLTLPAGFCATIFADEIGHARHLVVASNGVVYVNTWSGVYYGNDIPPAGGFLVALQDTSGRGKADVTQRFGETVQSGGADGTGIGIYKGALFAEINDKIVRYALPAGSIVPRDPPQTIVAGLPLGGDHPMHPFAIDAAGLMYVDVGTATNSCQPQNRTLESPGVGPGIKVKPVKGDPLCADRYCQQKRSHLAIEAILVHAEVGRGIAQSDEAR